MTNHKEMTTKTSQFRKVLPFIVGWKRIERKNSFKRVTSDMNPSENTKNLNTKNLTTDLHKQISYVKQETIIHTTISNKFIRNCSSFLNNLGIIQLNETIL